MSGPGSLHGLLSPPHQAPARTVNWVLSSPVRPTRPLGQKSSLLNLLKVPDFCALDRSSGRVRMTSPDNQEDRSVLVRPHHDA
jgi:hypothetical protein